MPADQSPEPVGLEPCPWCDRSTLQVSNWAIWSVRCRDCRAEQIGITRDAAIAAWNTRAPDPELATLRAQLAEAQEALVAHNDYLRSAAAIAKRHGQKTSWDHFLKAVTTTLSVHHEVTNKARQALAKIKGGDND